MSVGFLVFDLSGFDLLAFDLSAFDLLKFDLLAFDQSSATHKKRSVRLGFLTTKYSCSTPGSLVELQMLCFFLFFHKLSLY